MSSNLAPKLTLWERDFCMCTVLFCKGDKNDRETDVSLSMHLLYAMIFV